MLSVCEKFVSGKWQKLNDIYLLEAVTILAFATTFHLLKCNFLRMTQFSVIFLCDAFVNSKYFLKDTQFVVFFTRKKSCVRTSSFS